jgi:hypothetical protein
MAVNKTRWAIALLVLLSILPAVFGLYFYLEGSEQKCFLEELPKETLVTGTKTTVPLMDKSSIMLYKVMRIEVFSM